MFKYIVKRLALAVVILLGVSMIIYFLIRLMPVDFIQSKIDAISRGGATVSDETVKAMYEMYGLGDNTFSGILKGYFNWLGALCRFDLGTSFVHQAPVADIIVEHMGISFAIAFIATVFEFLIAIPLGITAATHQYSLRDYIVTVLVMIGISLPSFFFGNMLKDLLALKLGWLPPSGLVDATVMQSGMELLLDYVRHMVIPILTIVILSIGARMRMTRTNMLEVLNSDYIRTARAKGLKERVVINKHAFRNTLIPLVTSMAGLLPTLFSGAIITEQVFALPGIGNVALDAMNRGDIPFIMGYNMFLALLSVLGVLLADLMYAVVDPRVKLE
ncbi:MAG: ABC transporter permease [Clostridia bacterium]|nr:ABC transporter permease [Clostridia bacterium]